MTADAIGGVWTYALDLARGLSAHSVDVALATMGAPLSAAQRRDAAELPNLQVYESSYKLEWMDNPWQDVQRAGDWLLTLENEITPDVVHLNGYAHGQLPWRAPHLVVAHSCVLSWWRSVKGEEAPSEWSVYRSQISAGLRATEFVIAPTRAMLNCLHSHYGPLMNAGVIPNARRETLYGPSRKEPFVLAAGRLWDEAKNIASLCQVSPMLEWEVRIAGDARHPDGRSRTLEGVKVLGTLGASELADAYARASIYCLPARYEPFGLSILEAALSGCALVLGDIPSLRENWDGAAVFAPPGDPEALAYQLQDVINNGDRRRRLAARAIRRAARFSPERMTQSYLAVYSHLHQGIRELAIAGD